MTMKDVLALVVLAACGAAVAIAACGGDDSQETTTCAVSRDCERGKVCSETKCIEVPCAGHHECITAYELTVCYDTTATCTAIECGKKIPEPCPDGFECQGYYCQEKAKACTSNAHCAQPAEKCYMKSYECVLANYCEAHDDCPSDECNFEAAECVATAIDDVVETVEEDINGTQECTKEEFSDPMSFLCAACDKDADCGCDTGLCREVGGGTFCTIGCEAAIDCPSGFNCQDAICHPLGGQCKGCIQPPNCEEFGQTCNFKTGECAPEVPKCGFCVFDYECGPGYRCHKDDGDAIYCAPECDADNFSCPFASGCVIREDGIMICEPIGSECCYGLSCDTCACEAPTPFCLEEGGCAQCLSNSDCPPGKPVCNAETHSCIIQCLPPTPVYWTDPETGLEFCVECTKSKHCPPGYLCGTFKNEPATYHKCYPAPE